MWSTVGTVLTSVVGSSVLSAGITAWMNRNTSTSIERLKGRLEHGRFVTKAQLDIELAAYREVWDALSEFLNHARTYSEIEGLSKLVDGIDPQENRDRRFKWYSDEFKRLGEPNDAVVSSIARNRPFMSNDVYNACKRISGSCTQFYVNCLTDVGGSILSPEWQTVRLEWNRALAQAGNEIADLIRTRIESIQILKEV